MGVHNPYDNKEVGKDGASYMEDSRHIQHHQRYQLKLKVPACLSRRSLVLRFALSTQRLWPTVGAFSPRKVSQSPFLSRPPRRAMLAAL